MKNTSSKILKIINKKYALVKYDEDFASYSSLKATFKVKAIIEPLNIKSLIKIIKLLSKNNIKYNFFSYGTNCYLVDLDLVLINLSKLKKVNKRRRNYILVSGSEKMSYLANYYQKMGIDTFMGGTMIPGSIGAGIMINASVGEISINKYLKYIYVITEDGKKKRINIKDIVSIYRHTNINKRYIIYKAKFQVHYDIDSADTYLKLIEKRKNQPKGCSLGSVFLNTERYKVGRIIEESMLKGFRYNGFLISDIHANFIINENFGSLVDFENLLFIIKLAVLLKTNNRLNEEVIKLT